MYIDKKKYETLLKNKPVLKDVMINTLLSFLFGGGLSLFGEILVKIYTLFGIELVLAKTLMVLTVIFIASILSAFGIYDRLGQIGKAGLLVPISGFANGAVSASMEHKSEGFILGSSANVFKLVGSVIVLGVFFGVLVAFIKYCWYLI